MSAQTYSYATAGVRLLEATLLQQPPPGVTSTYVRQFFANFGGQLTSDLAALLDQILENATSAERTPLASDGPVPPEELLPDAWPAAVRTAANLAALRLLAAGGPIGPKERTTLLGYSGWGGLSLDAVANELPPAWRPERRGLIHEYYTPTQVAREIARVLRSWVLGLPSTDGSILALEPSAGIGRLLHACSGPGFEALRWTAVEFSHVSARILAAVRTDITVYEGPFERWITQSEEGMAGKLGLVVSNPPYGVRGATLTEDANRAYRERKAYAYFLRRGLDLLAAGGSGRASFPTVF